ncbi:MAG: hypothetical protein LBR19_00175, partial [Bifidobacteriaceae bacterium]|nr:hypothetical protein [Bifidobacteriaceae bacterium]
MSAQGPKNSSVTANVRRQFGRLVKPLVLLVSAAIALGGVTLIQAWQGAQQSDAADFPSTANWQPLPSTWSFEWTNGVGLEHDAAYIAPTPDVGNNAATFAAGMDVLERIVFDKDAGTSRAVSTLKARTTASGANLQLFTTAAIGPAPDDPDQLVVYFWGWGSDNGPYGTGLTCSGTSDGRNVLMLRVKSGATTGDVTCAPHDNGSLGTSWGEGSSTGGEVDQVTGRIYIQSNTSADIDSRAYNETGRNSADGFAFTIWDPQTGTAVRSGEIQPATQEDRYQLHYGVVNATAISDMTLDANGNIYMWVATGTAGVVRLIRVVPTRDAAGNPTEGSTTGGVGDTESWKYNFVMSFDHGAAGEPTSFGAADAGGWVGSFFDHGRIYATGYKNLNKTECTAGNSILEADPLSGAWKIYCTGEATPENDWHFFDRAARTGNNVDDGASPQTAAVIQARVFHDRNADGEISGSAETTGLSGYTVALYDADYKLVSTQTTNSEGWVSFMPSSIGNGTTAVRYYIRLVQPQINKGTTANPAWVNAAQTWALGGDDAGVVLAPGQNANDVIAQCTNGAGHTGGDLWTGTGGVACDGAQEVPYVDKTLGTLGSTSSPADWAYYSVVDMYTDRDVADVGFGITASGTWGDTQGTTKTTGAEGGAYHVNMTEHVVQLGDTVGREIDGTHSSDGNGHATDDGAFIELANGDLLPLQDQFLSVSRSYPVKANVTTSPATLADSVKVAGWASPLNSAAIASTTVPFMNTGLTNGVASGTLVAPSGTPTGAVAAAAVRMSATTAQNITMVDNTGGQYWPTKGQPTADTQAWGTDGEIEDYRVWYVTAQVRVALKTAGSTVTTDIPYTVTNVVNSSVNPSKNSGNLHTEAPDTSWTSNTHHAITSVSANTVITLGTLPSGYNV